MPRDGPQKGHAVWPSTAITQGHPGHEVLAVGTAIFGEDGDERPGGRAGGGRGTSCGMLRLEPCWGVRLGGGGGGDLQNSQVRISQRRTSLPLLPFCLEVDSVPLVIKKKTLRSKFPRLLTLKKKKARQATMRSIVCPTGTVAPSRMQRLIPAPALANEKFPLCSCQFGGSQLPGRRQHS